MYKLTYTKSTNSIHSDQVHLNDLFYVKKSLDQLVEVTPFHCYFWLPVACYIPNQETMFDAPIVPFTI